MDSTESLTGESAQLCECWAGFRQVRESGQHLAWQLPHPLATHRASARHLNTLSFIAPLPMPLQAATSQRQHTGTGSSLKALARCPSGSSA
jgi:hypothetical protein